VKWIAISLILLDVALTYVAVSCFGAHEVVLMFVNQVPPLMWLVAFLKIFDVKEAGGRGENIRAGRRRGRLHRGWLGGSHAEWVLHSVGGAQPPVYKGGEVCGKPKIDTAFDTPVRKQ